jgi:hypothetical protein
LKTTEAPHYFDTVLEKWQELVPVFMTFQDTPLSETDGRCKITDPLLKEVLQWEESLIIREPHVDSGFIDYFCSSDENKFVIESKSTKIDFKLNGSKKIKITSHKKLQKTNIELHKAIEQARSYGIDKGAEFCVVTNGLNIVIVRTIGNDGNDTIIMSGVECITQNLDLLMGILSPLSRGYPYFLERLNESENIRSTPAFMNSLIEKNYRRDTVTESPLTPYLNTTIADYFSDIANSDLLDVFYCDHKNLDEYGIEMKKFIRSRIPMLGFPIEEVKQIETNEGSKAGVFGTDMLRGFQTKANNGHVFVLFGNVGAGKSTFLSNFYENSIKGINEANLIWAYIDFQGWYGDADGVEDKIINELDKIIYSKTDGKYDDFEIILDIYKEEVDRKRRNVWKFIDDEKDLREKQTLFIESKLDDKKEHMEALLKYIKNVERKEICMVFDNLDQQPDSIQERVAFYALTKSKDVKVTSIISLRDETYWTMKTRPPMDAYGHITSYQIVPPSIKEVIEKRLSYLKDELGKQTIQFDSNGKAITLNYRDVISLIQETIRNEETVDLLKYMSAGNIRTALDIFSDIVTSGHTNLHAALNYLYKDPKNNNGIAFDKILKSVGMGKNVVYDAKNSRLLNLFDMNNFDGFYSHFINFRIIEILERSMDKYYSPDVPSGFMPLDKLLDELGVYCNNEESLRNLLVPLLNKHIVESDVGDRRVKQHMTGLDNIKYVRLTLSARYHIDTLIMNFQYLEMVMYDTKIMDRDIFNRMHELHMKHQMQKRKKKFFEAWATRFELIELFLDYLKRKEEEDLALLEHLSASKYHDKIIPSVIRNYRNYLKPEIMAKMKK